MFWSSQPQEIFTPQKRGLGSVTPLSEDDFQWIHTGPYGHSEAQTWYCFFDDGAYLVFQAAFTYISLSSLVQVSVRYYNPNTGDNFIKSYSYNGSDFNLSPNKTSYKCSNLSVMHNPGAGFHISFQEPEMDLKLHYEFISGGFKIGDGITLYGGIGTPDEKGKKSSNGWLRYWFAPKGKISGSLKVLGKERKAEGSAYSFFAYQGMKPHHVADNWQLCVFQSPRLALSMLQCETPTSHTVIDQSLAHFTASSSTVISEKSQVLFENSKIDDVSGYKVPESIQFEWNGKTAEGKDFHFKINITPNEKTTEKIDVLSNLSYIPRKVVQVLIAKPFLYQIMQDVEVQGKIGDETFVEKGRALVELTFVNGLGRHKE
ncbi:oxidative stress survival, Svf1-like protein [Paraphysoderma sedebokerense]|nr:oxidative stress survival, Svf1-like protein [Paraphysoderma sedebokerense]